jgi:hypothetical protein
MAKQRGKPENLKQWKKGQSGNPKGRKKGDVNVLHHIKKQLALIAPGQRKAWALLIAEKAVKKASRGDYQFAKLIIEHQDGTPVQKVLHGNTGDEPFRVVMVPAATLKDE